MPSPDLLGCSVLLSQKEFSHLVSLSLRTVAKLIASGEIRSIRVGRRRLIRRTELMRFAMRDHLQQATSGIKSTHGKKVGR
jgi:excisionase family DNA binding protein